MEMYAPSSIPSRLKVPDVVVRTLTMSYETPFVFNIPVGFVTYFSNIKSNKYTDEQHIKFVLDVVGTNKNFIYGEVLIRPCLAHVKFTYR